MSATKLSRRESQRWTYLPAFAQAQLPRYTSYPPANRFSPAVNAFTAAEALKALPEDASISLYLHIPYCQKLCWYCGCHTSVPTRADPIDTYLDALRREMSHVSRLLPSGARVTHVHLGGGSPDSLSPAQISALFESIQGFFDVSPFAEIAAELDPRNATPEVIEALAVAGLTRASLGVQVFDGAVQAKINRTQTREEVEAAILRLRENRVKGVNIDMMYGLPGQTIEHVIETALFAARQDADRIAVFGYAHVPWFKKHQKAIDVAELPQGEARFRQAEAACDTLQRAGYIPIGFDHFAAPGDSLATASLGGRLHRNFQGYTDDDATALIGLGASAISHLPGLFYQNAPDTGTYRATINGGELAVARGTVVSEDDRRIAGLIERILCDFEADIPADIQIHASAALADLTASGLTRRQAGRLFVTDKGRPYVRNIAAAFDPEMQANTGRHSLAV